MPVAGRATPVEDRRASRDCLGGEVEPLHLNGFSREPPRRRWERCAPANPGVNIATAQWFGRELAASRKGREIG